MKQKITRAVAILCYWFGIDSFFYFLNRKAKRIVTFHNVLPDSLFRPGVANGVSTTLSSFAKTIDACAERFGFSTDFDDPATITITFDDGYRNQYSTAFKELKKRSIPACLFVSGEIAVGGLQIDRILHWVAEAPEECIPGSDRLAYWVGTVWPAFSADGTNKGQSVFAMLDAKYPYSKIEKGLPDEYRRERLSGISPEELDEMRAAGWKIGWHTRSHFPLAALSQAEQDAELAPPEGFGDICFSYPYGNPCEVGEYALGKVKAFGYPCAVSNTNSSELNTSRHFMPRMALPSDKYLLHFELSGIKHFLRTRRLLPVTSRGNMLSLRA